MTRSPVELLELLDLLDLLELSMADIFNQRDATNRRTAIEELRDTDFILASDGIIAPF